MKCKGCDKSKQTYKDLCNCSIAHLGDSLIAIDNRVCCKYCRKPIRPDNKPKQHPLDELLVRIKEQANLSPNAGNLGVLLKKLRYESIKWGLSQRLENYWNRDCDFPKSFDAVLKERGHEEWIV